MGSYDAIIVGSGPNGLSAAVALAQHGCKVLVVERSEQIGGGARSAELTLPGFTHDVCSAIHPFAVASSFLRTLPLESHGLEWIQPDLPLAHPLDGGRAVLLARSVEETAASLGEDGGSYRRLFEPLVEGWQVLLDDVVGPLRLPKHPLQAMRFGKDAIRSAGSLARSRFREEEARALFAGIAAHSVMDLSRSPTAAFGLILGLLAHAVGWPVPRGGAQKIPDALADHLGTLGGKIEVGWEVNAIGDLPEAKAYLLDLAPKNVARIAKDRLPDRYLEKLERFRYGPGVFKLDLALDGPVPWAAPDCARAGTVHVAGTLEEIEASERAVSRGEQPEKPYVLVAQQSLFDESRAPEGKQILWAYCHVPQGSDEDRTDAIEEQIERFAPGFRDRILARHTMTAVEMEQHNPNYVGGDINGGVADLKQLFARPAARLVPYATPAPDIFLCSASTPPGGGVHGLCGYYAARAAIGRRF